MNRAKLPFKAILLILVLSLLPFTSSEEKVEGSWNDEVKGFHSPPISLTVHAPISIDNNSDLSDTASAEGWKGTGTEEDPYRIEDLWIDGQFKKLGIYIGNTTDHLLIYNCSVLNVVYQDPSSALALWSASNITVLNCTFFNSSNGILIDGSDNITVIGSHIHNNTWYGIMIYGKDINITRNLIERNGNNGIYSLNLESVLIDGNKVVRNSAYGLKLGQFIRECRIVNNFFYGGIGGISVDGNLWLDDGYCTAIKNNSCIGNEGIGIYIYYSRGSSVTFNNCSGYQKGIVVDNSGNITYNVVSNCSQLGIYSGRDSLISWNTVNGVGSNGIEIHQTSSNVNNNTVRGCKRNGLLVYSEHTLIERNLIHDNLGNGIEVDSINVTLRKNLISGNGENGTIMSGNFHTTQQNVIFENSNSGILVVSGTGIQLVGDHVYENQGDGIEMIRGWGGSINGLDIHDNDGSGIRIDDVFDIQMDSVSTSYNNGTNMIISVRNDVTIHDCTVFSTREGIVVRSGGHVNISKTAVFDLEIGINLAMFGSVRMTDNFFQGCGLFFSDLDPGGPIDLSRTDIGPTNRVNTGFLYLINSSFNGTEVPEDAGQVFIFGHDDLTLDGLDLSHTTIGLKVIDSENIVVKDCSFDKDPFGIQMNGTYGISISSCSFKETGSGIELWDVMNGRIQDCRFISGRSIGVHIEHNSTWIEIESNLFFGTKLITAYAIWISADNCTIWNNQFIYNRGTGNDNVSYLHQAYNEGANQWYKGRTGNYWRDLHYPDLDNDGLVDGAYDLEGPIRIIDPYPSSHSPLFEPPKLNATGSIFNDTIVLDWTAPDLEGWAEPRGFRIFRMEFPGDPVEIAVVGPDERRFIDRDAVPTVDYRYHVTALNSLVESDRSNIARALLDEFLPQLFIIAPLDGEVISDTTVRAEWLGVDNESGIDHYEIKLDLDDWIDMGKTENHVFFDLAEGTHLLKVKVVDQAGGEVIEQISFLIDLGDPTVMITSPGNGAVLSTNETTITWKATDGLSGIERFEYRLDDGNLTGAGRSESVYFMNLSEGEHSFFLTAYDMGGNDNSTRVEFIVDTIHPIVEIISPTDGMLSESRDIKVIWEGFDFGVGVYNYLFKLDQQDWIDLGMRSDRNLWQLEDGGHEVWVQVRDGAGNIGIDNASFTIDTTPPELEIRTPKDGSFISQSPVSVTWTVSDAISGVEGIYFRDNRSDWQRVESLQYSLFGLEEKTYTIWLKAVDAVGNEIEISSTFTVDRTLPMVIGFGPEGDSILLEEPVFVSFSERMSRTGLRFVVEGAKGSVVWKGERALFEPDERFEPSRQYNVSISGSDLAGNPLPVKEWSFNTTVHGKLRGKVVRIDGASVPDAKVEVGDISVLSRPDGGFFVELRNGTYKLRISKDGYRTLTVDVNITAGEILELSDLVLEKKKKTRIDLLAILMIPLAILLMVALAAIIGTLINRSSIGIEEE